MDGPDTSTDDAVGLADNVVLEVWSGAQTSVRELVINYLRAVERFRAQDVRSTVIEEQLQSESLAKAALAEALSWADTLDQRLGQWPKDERPSKKIRKSQRQAPWAVDLDEDAHDLVEAFQHARNVVHHRWFDLVSVRISVNGDGQVNLWTWAPLPGNKRPGDNKSPELDGIYATKLEGRHLLETLDELAYAFWQKRRHQIRRAAIGQPGHDVQSPLIFDDE
jgi:hypothetical protein